MSVFKKYLLKFDESSFNNAISNEKAKINVYQSIVDEYNLLGIENKLNEKDMFPIFENPKDFLAEKILNGESMKIGAVTVSKDRLFDFIEDPEKYLTFIENIRARKGRVYGSQHENWLYSHSDFYIVDGNKVVFSVEAEEKLKNHFSLFIENEKQDKVYKKLKQLADLSNELLLLKESKWLDADFLNRYLKRETPKTSDSLERQKFEVNLDQIKAF